MASRAMIGWTNRVNTGTLFPYSQATNFPLSNLQNDIGAPSLGWQTVNGILTPGAGAKFSISASGTSWRAVILARTNLSSTAVVTFTLRTGTDPGSVSTVATITGIGPLSRYRSVIGVFAADTNADSCLVSITDSSNPDGYINVPLCFAGPVWTFESPPSWSTEWGREDRRDSLISLGGQEWVTPRWQRRVCQLKLTGVRASETFTQLDLMDFDVRDGRNVLFIPDYSSATIAQEAIYGMVNNMAPIGYPYGGADRRSWAASITERL